MLQGVLSLDGTLSKKEQKKRTIMFSFASLAFCAAAGNWLMNFSQQMAVPVYFYGSVVLMATYLAVVVAILLRVPLSVAFIVGSLYVQCAVFFALELSGRSLYKPQWPLLVLMIDMLLVMQVDSRYSLWVVIATVFWLLLLAFEESFRFGLLDLPGLFPQEGEYGRIETIRKMADCDTLPCPVKFPADGTVTAVVVFVLDYIATRGFARGVQKEQAAMEKTIEAVQEIASLLAKYDVEGVARMLKMREAELPEQMYETLQTMERNLRMYRPYLPAALFDEMEDEGSRVSFGPPGVESETATIVFTDIRSSTTIWEHAPEGMRAGLKIHNAVMREVMQAFGGYEVKTIGDAFMIAFASTQDGVNFGLRVHERLREAVWPDSLLEDAPICTEQGSLWGGLTVRIGVNTGPVTVEQNALTGRTDYFGHTVNVAARVESTCKPGAVAVPSDLWEACCMCCDAAVGGVESLELKGVSEPVDMRCLWPLSLAGRKYTPLEAGLLPTGDTVMDFTGQTLCETLAQARYSAAATIGVVQVSVNSPDHGSALHDMNIGIAALTVALDQSGGALVSLLGSRVCVGWNLTRATQAHAENAVRFVQRLHDGTSVAGAGLASGPVEHGDVGTRTQRFMTVMGPSVHRSWTLCEEAVDEGKVCLYEPPQGTALPASLAGVLHPSRHPGVYESKCDGS